MKKMSLGFISLCLCSCISQQQVVVDWTEPTKASDFTAELENKEVYLHDAQGAYKAENVNWGDSGLAATLVWRVSPADLEELRNPQGRKEQRRHKNDVNIYLNQELETLSAAVDGKQPAMLQRRINKASIDRIQTYRVNTKKSFSDTLLLVVLVFFLALIFVYLLAYLFAYASAEASGQSSGNSGSGNSGSGQSNSGSNSDSGNSGSGGSGGSGSGSGSGSRPGVPPILEHILSPTER